ncbi:MAG TPA: chromosomal replication initiator protein DnaA [Candidatus Eisenbacteria bacterium]|nr:chromosomal replication initiator protein DnaA [Candidatus Eisenbacteria bacterium]
MDNSLDTSAVDLWSKAIDALKKELSPHVFDRWLSPIHPVEIQDDALCLEVPDDFFKTWIVDHYGSLISLALKEASGESVNHPVFIIQKEIREGATASHASPTLTPSVVSSPTAPAIEGMLNHKYTFESFVVGPSNRFAHAASMAVAETPAKAYNPLFIYGPVGLGKTHLMQAIGQEVLRRSSAMRVLYITSEKFTNQLINAIKTGTTIKFREKYRNVDCLLIDDIHFIAGKEATMEEFFHTFNTLYDSHKQIVVSSDKPPKDINNLEERLVSRFEWGLVTDIQAPDYETRAAILRKKAERENLHIPDSVTSFIADKIKSNIRELEGALIRVVAYSKLVGKEVDEAIAYDVLKDMIVETSKKITVDLIQRKVAEYFEVRPSDMTAKRRSKNVVYPRHVAMYLSREMTGLSFPEIGEQFGGRDHSTILHACEKMKKDVKKDPKAKSLVEKLINEIKK